MGHEIAHQSTGSSAGSQVALSPVTILLPWFYQGSRYPHLAPLLPWA